MALFYYQSIGITKFITNRIKRLFVISFILIFLNSCKFNNYYVSNNSYKSQVLKIYVLEGFQEGVNSYDIRVAYPQLVGLKNELLQKVINDSLRFKFLRDFTDLPYTESRSDSLYQNTEVTYNYYISHNTLSILSQEMTSSNRFAGNRIEAYNVDINTGKFLTNEDLVDNRYFNEITSLVLEKNFLYDNNSEEYQELYKYYSSIKEEVFNRFKIQILKESVTFIFYGDSDTEPLYYVEVPKEKIKKYFIRKNI